jgi:hypothetical protein
VALFVGGLGDNPKPLILQGSISRQQSAAIDQSLIVEVGIAGTYFAPIGSGMTVQEEGGSLAAFLQSSESTRRCDNLA